MCECFINSMKGKIKLLAKYVVFTIKFARIFLISTRTIP